MARVILYTMLLFVCASMHAQGYEDSKSLFGKISRRKCGE